MPSLYAIGAAGVTHGFALDRRAAEAVDSTVLMSSGRCNESPNNQLAVAALTAMMGS